MGVRGLTTYIADNSKLYLKPYELCDTYLVIDGNSIASNLYKWCSKSDSAFGGDYDEYYKIVKDFFQTLKKCGVIPIVLFDGAYESKKIKTCLSRAAGRYPLLRALFNRFSSDKFFPLFMKQTFFDVMDDLEIFCIQCDFEADIEIATLARTLNCPVMSYDSDFYIFDVLYIPFSSVYAEACRVEDADGNVKSFVKCSIYDVTSFLNEFSGLDKSLLPILATLLGNDYIDSSIFSKFFLHVSFPKCKNKSYTQRKIHGVLNWLKKENVESATKLILSHLENKHSTKVLQAINSSIRDYTNSWVSAPVISAVNKFNKSINNSCLDLNVYNLQSDLPEVTKNLFYKCKLHKFIMDIITLNVYFSQLQVENVYQQSCHFSALNIISAIYLLLEPYVVKGLKPFSLYLTSKNSYTSISLENDSLDYLKDIILSEIVNDSHEKKLKLLYKILEVSDDEVKTVNNFSEDWSVFVLAFIYWVKQLNKTITLAHIHALLLMAISNEVVQKKVGYYRIYSKFNKKKGHLLSDPKDTVLSNDEIKNNFNDLLSEVTMYECLLTQKNIIPFRQTTEKGRGKSYNISIVHLFGCFQSCLYHIMQLNALLNYPLRHLRISNFYSGTLLYNFYLKIIEKPNVLQFGCELLKDTPNLNKLYVFICENLCKYSNKEHICVKIEKKQKRKSKKLNKNKEYIEELGLQEPDIDENNLYNDENNLYNDENNMYALLQNVKIN